MTWFNVFGEAQDAPAPRRVLAELFLQGKAIVGDQHYVATPRAQPVEDEHGFPIGLAEGVLQLDNQHPLPLERRMLDRRGHRADHPPELHRGNSRFERTQTNLIPPTIAVRRWRQKVSGVVTPSPVGPAMEKERTPSPPRPSPAGLGPLTTNTVQSMTLPIFDMTEVSREWRIAVWP